MIKKGVKMIGDIIMDEEMIKNEIQYAKKEFDKWLRLLSICIEKRYGYNGYATDYIMRHDGVDVIFQRIGGYHPCKYIITFGDIFECNKIKR